MRGAVLLLAVGAPLAAQVPGDSTGSPPATVVQAPAPRYKADGVQRFFLGKDYRQLWYTPATVEVLDLEHFGGGLTPLGRTGGQETTGLRLGTKDGHQYFFRSIDKDPSLTLPEELRGTIANRVVQDQISSANPLAPVVVARLMDATSILHNSSLIVVMPDSPILGEYRPVFAGLMGVLEERVGGSGPAAHWHGGYRDHQQRHPVRPGRSQRRRPGRCPGVPAGAAVRHVHRRLGPASRPVALGPL